MAARAKIEEDEDTAAAEKAAQKEMKRVAGEEAKLKVIRHIGAQGLDRKGPAGSCRPFLGPGFRLAARWNRLVETVKTRKKRGKTGTHPWLRPAQCVLSPLPRQ